MVFCKELFEFQDKLYYIKRIFNITELKQEHLTNLKVFWGCDKVVKTSTHYMFLVEILDVEEINEPELPTELLN